MNTTLQKDINKKRSNNLESNFDKYVTDKSHIVEYPKSVWFKGCRHR